MLLLALAAGSLAAPAREVVELRTAQLRQPGQPPVDVQLPATVPPAGAPDQSRAVYRLAYDAAALPQGYALYFPGLMAHARVTLNGAVLSNRLLDAAGPTPLNGRAIVLLPVADGLWRVGRNEIEIAVGGTRDASVSPLQVGPAALLEAAGERREFLKTTGPVLVSAVIGSFGLCVLLLWARQGSHALYGYFGGGALVWAVHTAWSLSGVRLPAPHNAVLWSWMFGLFVGMLVIFCVRFAEWRWPRFERAVWLWMAAGLPWLYGAVRFDRLDDASSLWRLSCVGFTLVGVGAVMVYAWRKRNADSVLLSLASLAGGGFGLRDWLVAQRELDNNPVWLVPYAGLPFVMLVAWILIDRFVATSRELEHMNAELEARVARKSAELVQAAEQMRRAKEQAESANRAKSSFLAAASHDLRQPVHALGLYTAALRHESPTPQQQELLARMSGSVLALDSMFNALLDISRMDAGAVTPLLRPFAVEPLLHRLAEEFAAQAQEQGLRLGVRVSPRLEGYYLSSDLVLVERIVRNLLSNAVKYTRRGGVLLSCRLRGAGACVEVWDTGPGIPTVERERVFDEFYQVGNPERDRASGLGLGLSIVRRLTGLLGLPLRLTSTPGRGTRFAFELPLTREAPRRHADAPAISLEGLHVAVVEDDAEVRGSMRALLGRWGCRVSDGADAGELLAALAAADDDEPPHAIVADFRLRSGRNGVDAVHELRAALGLALPALIVTGDSAPERLAGIQASGLEWLSKPVPAARLRSWLGAAWQAVHDAEEQAAVATERARAAAAVTARRAPGARKGAA